MYSIFKTVCIRVLNINDYKATIIDANPDRIRFTTYPGDNIDSSILFFYCRKRKGQPEYKVQGSNEWIEVEL